MGIDKRFRDVGAARKKIFRLHAAAQRANTSTAFVRPSVMRQHAAFARDKKKAPTDEEMRVIEAFREKHGIDDEAQRERRRTLSNAGFRRNASKKRPTLPKFNLPDDEEG